MPSAVTLNSGSPVFRVSWLGFARGDPTWGLSVLLFSCSVGFLLGSSPGLGRVFPPRRSDSRSL